MVKITVDSFCALTDELLPQYSIAHLLLCIVPDKDACQDSLDIIPDGISAPYKGGTL